MNESEEKVEAFKAELKALLLKYNACLFCDIDGDTHGLINTMMLEIAGKDYPLVNGTYIEPNDLIK